MNKFQELKNFLEYHIRNNPKRTLEDIKPLLNEMLKSIGETQLKKDK